MKIKHLNKEQIQEIIGGGYESSEKSLKLSTKKIKHKKEAQIEAQKKPM